MSGFVYSWRVEYVRFIPFSGGGGAGPEVYVEGGHQRAIMQWSLGQSPVSGRAAGGLTLWPWMDEKVASGGCRQSRESTA